jgi:hypothetical protein
MVLNTVAARSEMDLGFQGVRVDATGGGFLIPLLVKYTSLVTICDLLIGSCVGGCSLVRFLCIVFDIFFSYSRCVVANNGVFLSRSLQVYIRSRCCSFFRL